MNQSADDRLRLVHYQLSYLLAEAEINPDHRLGNYRHAIASMNMEMVNVLYGIEETPNTTKGVNHDDRM